MPAPYSTDLRIRVIHSYNSGMKISKIAKLFNIVINTVRNWITRYKETGVIDAKKNYHKGHSEKISDLNELKNFVDAHPHLTGIEIAKHFNVASSTLCKKMKFIGYTRKKRPLVIKNVRK
jgi:transposase